jgi:hypothetical protein
MANFGDVKLPPTFAEKREWEMAAKAADAVKECPFCKAPMKCSAAVNTYFYPIIEKDCDLYRC